MITHPTPDRIFEDSNMGLIHGRVRGTGAVFQNSRSACTHRLSGILQLGRTAKTRPPSVRAASSASRRVRKA